MSTDLREQLQATLDGYTLEHELGGGGMARVFAAVETALGRRIVIKVLSPELAAGLSGRRFAREIRLVASLQQANIVPVLSAGETNGLPYYTMPFVDGLSLRGRFSRGPLSFTETIGVLRDVARALAYAHEHGVVHRDIKPENILLSGDAAVVTDFGIAKAISDARTTEGAERGTTVTQAGTIIGTPAYMAPEQIAADPTADHRSDLYSYGCVAYELITGAAPFAGRGAPQLLGAHLSEHPGPIGEKRPDCPATLARLVMQCLEKDPDRRPQSAREILRGLDAIAVPTTWLGRFGSRLPRRPAVGALVALVVTLGTALLVLSRTGRNSASLAIPTRSVAVLPFANIGGDSTQEYLADGIADELATALGKLGGMRVVSRSLTYQYKGRRDIDARDVGEALAVDYLVHGTVRRVGERLRVSAQLTNAADNSEFWADRYERDADDILAVPNEIARAIATTLRGSAVSSVGEGAGATSDPEAYDLYLRGRFLLERRGGGVAQAVENFERAIVKDSNFARAHAGLSLALELLPNFSDVSASSVRERAIAAAQRALSLDSTQSEPHTALGLVHMHAWDWKQAEAEHRRAIELDSTETTARFHYGRLLYSTGRLLESRAEFERARALDPYSAVASAWLARLLWLTGRETEAVAEIERALQLDSTNSAAMYQAISIFLQMRRHGDARALADRFPWRSTTWRGLMARAYGALGDREQALRIVREIESRRPPAPYADIALANAYLGVGDTARALDALERATAAGEPWPTHTGLSEPYFDPVRSSPRFAALVRRVGLDERIFTRPAARSP